jgi:hypothetical protein
MRELTEKTNLFSVEYRKMKELANKIDSKLIATDIRFKNSVKLVDEDGSVINFENAFIERKGNWIFLFCEHHSCDVFYEDDLRYYVQYRKISVANIKFKEGEN